jgi:hypothetical protein
METNAMGETIKAQELRELLATARKLRRAAAEAAGKDYIELFLHAASALEDRAARIAYGSPTVSIDWQADEALHARVDLVC